VELALKRGNGTLCVLLESPDAEGGWEEELISENFACAKCGISLGELLPRNFSFNSPFGACPACDGLGKRMIFQPGAVIPDDSLSIKKGAIPLWRRGPRHLIMLYNHYLRCLAEHYNFSLTTP
jgi:excinuclease ABC subunit A